MQTRDIIFFEGAEYFLLNDPLASRGGMPNFIATSTANHRGYEAVWAVVSSRLFLVSLSGCVVDESRKGFELVFPSAHAPVLADWYSGELGLLSGRVIDQSEIDPLFEHETTLTIEMGYIRSRRSFSREYLPVQRFDPMLHQPINSLEELEPKLLGQLAAASIHSVGDLVRIGELELAKTANLSIDAAIEVKEALACRGLVLGTRLPGWNRSCG